MWGEVTPAPRLRISGRLRIAKPERNRTITNAAKMHPLSRVSRGKESVLPSFVLYRYSMMYVVFCLPLDNELELCYLSYGNEYIYLYLRAGVYER